MSDGNVYDEGDPRGTGSTKYTNGDDSADDANGVAERTPTTEQVLERYAAAAGSKFRAEDEAEFYRWLAERDAAAAAPALAEVARIGDILDRHLPTIITGLQQVVYQNIHKSRDELDVDDVALRSALSAAHWVAKDIVTQNGAPLYDLPSVLDLMKMKKSDVARIAELESALAELAESVLRGGTS